MRQRLAQRFVAVLDLHIFSDHGDAHFAFGILHPLHHLLPARQIGRRRILQPEDFQQLGIQAHLVISDGHAIDGVQIQRRDHPVGGQVAEQTDLAALLIRDGMGSAAEQNVRLNADGAQFLDAVLGGLGLELPRRFDIGHQGEMDEGGLAAAQIIVQLADGLEKRQALDIAHRTADLDQKKIQPVGVGQHEFLDHVGDVRDHLHGAPQIAALALLLDHLAVDASRSDIVGFERRDASEAFIMPQIQIGLRAIVGDINLAMLERAHRARIDIKIGIEFAQTDFVTARLKQRAKSGGRQTFSEGRDHAAGDED